MPCPKLKVAFTDFWYGLDHENNILSAALRKRFQVEVSEKPDILFCSAFSNNWREFDCPRILVIGENIEPDLELFDASLSFYPASDRNFYLPFYMFYPAYASCFQERKLSLDDWNKKKRAAAIFTNARCKFRNWFFHYLKENGGADSGGKAFNNVGGPVKDKALFLNKYKFSMAFENTRWPGYTTEKLIEAYAFGTVPLYWGDPSLSGWFNRKSLFEIKDKADAERALKEIEKIEDDFDAYRSVYEEPLFEGNREPKELSLEAIADFLESVIDKGLSRARLGRISNYRAFIWQYRWRHSQWDYSYLPLIRFFRMFVLFSFLKAEAKQALKRILRWQPRIATESEES